MAPLCFGTDLSSSFMLEFFWDPSKGVMFSVKLETTFFTKKRAC
jgi:hypothetical protein